VANEHFLPSKVLTYLRRVELEFERTKKTLLLQIVRSCRVYVREETDYDNWNGGTYGHDASPRGDHAKGVARDPGAAPGARPYM